MRSPLARVDGYFRRRAATLFFRRRFVVAAPRPLISFTFDDFPISAFTAGGAILKRHGLSGTYYASLGIAGREEAAGRMFGRDDLAAVLGEGHELGCHTYSHCDAWRTSSGTFEESVARNQAVLASIVPDLEFKTLSYPIEVPWPPTKSRIAGRFLCCRGGGQTFNSGVTDLSMLSAYFLEKSRDRLDVVRNTIDLNAASRGWLIFATHDISEAPTPFGCTPGFFEAVVGHAVRSGALILPVSKALEWLKAGTTDHQ